MTKARRGDGRGLAQGHGQGDEGGHGRAAGGRASPSTARRSTTPCAGAWAPSRRMRESVRRVGQRFMIGFDGLEASPDVKRLIREFGVGHVILFARNVADPEQVAELKRELQETARDAGPRRCRCSSPWTRRAAAWRGMGPPWTVWPPLRALGPHRLARSSPARMGAALAAELRGLRHQLRLRADRGRRHEPEEPDHRRPLVRRRSRAGGRLGAAMIEGLQGGGVVACAKHFPGHGDTDVDSHLELPAVEQRARASTTSSSVPSARRSRRASRRS